VAAPPPPPRAGDWWLFGEEARLRYRRLRRAHIVDHERTLCEQALALQGEAWGEEDEEEGGPSSTWPAGHAERAVLRLKAALFRAAAMTLRCWPC
jgi:hypothetical protein